MQYVGNINKIENMGFLLEFPIIHNHKTKP